MENKRPIYGIGDKIYHVSVEEENPGIIVDIKYSYRYNEFEYLVSLAFGTYFWVNEIEINNTKSFV